MLYVPGAVETVEELLRYATRLPITRKYGGGVKLFRHPSQQPQRQRRIIFSIINSPAEDRDDITEDVQKRLSRHVLPVGPAATEAKQCSGMPMQEASTPTLGYGNDEHEEEPFSPLSRSLAESGVGAFGRCNASD